MSHLARILEKYMWRSSFLVNLQACRLIAGNFTNIWTPSQIFFNSSLRPAPPQIHAASIQVPPCSQHLWISSPGISAHWGDGKFCWEGNFYVVVGIWGGVILTIQTFFKAKKQHIVKIPPVGVKVKFCREEENFFYWVVEIWGQGSGNRI